MERGNLWRKLCQVDNWVAAGVVPAATQHRPSDFCLVVSVWSCVRWGLICLGKRNTGVGMGVAAGVRGSPVVTGLCSHHVGASVGLCVRIANLTAGLCVRRSSHRLGRSL
jgi:hypothetical protein